MAEGVVIIDPDGKPTYANPMAQRIKGMDEMQFKDRRYNDSKWQNERIDGSPMPLEEHPMHKVMLTRKPVYDQEICLTIKALRNQ